MRRKNKRTANTASAAIQILWEEGYFKNLIDRKKVATHLSKRGNNFPDNTLRMALSRGNFNGFIKSSERKSFDPFS
jgi:hypothetical protein